MLYPIELRVRFEVLEYGEGSRRNQAINWIDSNKLRVSIGDTAIPSFESIPRSGTSRSLMREPRQNQGSPFRSLREDILFNPVDPVIPVQKSPFHHFRAERHSSDSAKQRTRKARINHCRSLHQPLCPLRSRWLRFFSSNLQPLDIAQIDGYSLPVSSGSHSAVG